jgi:hypothetical protein
MNYDGAGAREQGGAENNGDRSEAVHQEYGGSKNIVSGE